MTKQQKHQLITNSATLLQVESKLKKLNKNIILVFNIICLSILVGYALYFSVTTKDIVIAGINILFLAIIYGVILVLSYNKLNSGNPLIITEKGIVMAPYLAEEWSDLDGYNFITYSSINRITVSSIGTGVSILLHNKGGNQRSINWKGHSIIALNGIFLNEEQISIIDDILNKHGLLKGNT